MKNLLLLVVLCVSVSAMGSFALAQEEPQLKTNPVPLNAEQLEALGLKKEARAAKRAERKAARAAKAAQNPDAKTKKKKKKKEPRPDFFKGPNVRGPFVSTPVYGGPDDFGPGKPAVPSTLVNGKPLTEEEILSNMPTINEMYNQTGASPPQTPSAQEAQARQRRAGNVVAMEVPPEDLVAFDTPTPMRGRVPTLPTARSCQAKDFKGLWRLMQVYEEPLGLEEREFTAYPVQYLRYMPDQSFKSLRSDNVDISWRLAEINDELESQTQGLQQFVLQDGMVFFYRDGEVFRSSACFMVEKNVGEFKTGQMLFMPPTPKSATRWVQVYQRMKRKGVADKASEE